jgi:V8-like Glu-specific endopeptidase
MNANMAIVLTLLLTLVSCGKGGSGNAKKLTTITDKQIQQVMDNQNFECDGINGASCPEGMARLLYVNKADADQSSVCSGFMVNKNTLVTNQHCIGSQEICNNTYVAIYNGYSYQQTKCQTVKKIIGDNLTADDPNKRLDVAIVQVADDFYGTTFNVSSIRPKGGDKLSAWVVDHTGLDSSIKANLYESRITQFNCYVSSQTERKSMMLESCPVIHGNSGSPLLNQSGEVVGIIWGGTALSMDTSWDLDQRRSSSFEAASTEAYYFSSALLN